MATIPNIFSNLDQLPENIRSGKITVDQVHKQISDYRDTLLQQQKLGLPVADQLNMANGILQTIEAMSRIGQTET